MYLNELLFPFPCLKSGVCMRDSLKGKARQSAVGRESLAPGNFVKVMIGYSDIAIRRQKLSH